MTRKARPALWVRGSKEFQARFGALDKDLDEYRAVDQTLSVLKNNILAGVQVPKKQWPRVYVKEYEINNLYKVDIRGGRRLTYTIVAEDQGCSVSMLDYFRSHKEYEVFFGY